MNSSSAPTLLEKCEDTPARDKRNLARVVGAFLAWAVCFVTASQLIKRGVVEAGWAAWLLAAIPTAVGLMILLAYARFLRESDELQRRIQLEALAIGFGSTFVVASNYRVFERLGAPALGAAGLIAVMGVFYALGALIGWSRYR